jgi:hypothetical protein
VRKAALQMHLVRPPCRPGKLLQAMESSSNCTPSKRGERRNRHADEAPNRCACPRGEFRASGDLADPAAVPADCQGVLRAASANVGMDLESALSAALSGH